MQLTKLISDIGGILGIFIGVSAISFAEILYLIIHIMVIVLKRKSFEEVEQKQHDRNSNEDDNMTVEDVELHVSEDDENGSDPWYILFAAC